MDDTRVPVGCYGHAKVAFQVLEFKFNTNPGLISYGLLIREGTPQIVIIWYLNGIPPTKQPRGLLIQGWHYAACLWAACIGRRNLEKMGENFLQSAHCFSLGPAGSTNNEIVCQVCPQFRVGCHGVPIIRLLVPGVRLKFWCPVMSTMSLQHVHRQVSKAGFFGPTLQEVN